MFPVIKRLHIEVIAFEVVLSAIVELAQWLLPVLNMGEQVIFKTVSLLFDNLSGEVEVRDPKSIPKLKN